MRRRRENTLKKKYIYILIYLHANHVDACGRWHHSVHAIGMVKPQLSNPVLSVEQIQRFLRVVLQTPRVFGALTPQRFSSMIIYIHMRILKSVNALSYNLMTLTM